MPLARIITRFPESSRSLVSELKARGFDVETIPPEVSPSELSDLEFRVEECSVEEALRRATQSAGAESSVFIASEAITPEIAPIAVLPFFQKLTEPDETANKIQTSEPLKDGSPVREEAARAPEETPPNVLATTFENYHPPLPHEETSPTQDNRWSGEQPELPIEATPVVDPGESFIQAQTEHREFEQIAGPRSQEIEPDWEQQSVSSPSETTSAEDLPSPVLREPEDHELGDSSEPALVVDRDLEPALWQSAQPSSDWPIWSPLAECESGEGAAFEGSKLPVEQPGSEHESYSVPLSVSHASLAPDAISKFGDSGIMHRFSGEDHIFWKTAALATVCAVTVLLLGIFAHRVSPIPAGLVQGSELEQQPPLLKAKRGTNPAEGNRVLLTVSEPAAAKSSESITSAGQIHTAHPNLAPSKQPETTRPAPFARVGSDFVAEDTVVRFGGRAGPATAGAARPAQSKKKSGVKHYSDLN
jgi:hypothetical protein